MKFIKFLKKFIENKQLNMKTIITLFIFFVSTLNSYTQIKEEEKAVMDTTYLFLGDLTVRGMDCELFINDIPAIRFNGSGNSFVKSNQYLKAGTNTISVILQPVQTSIANRPKSISCVFVKSKIGQSTSEAKQLASIKWEANEDEKYPIVLKDTFELSEKDFPISFPWHKAEVITKKDIEKAEPINYSYPQTT